MGDHGITLRHIIEKVWEKKEEAFCCFVDFKKAFDTVPRDKLWHRMQELGVPIHLRAVVHRLYKEVKSKSERQLVSLKVSGAILGSSRGAHCSLPCLAYILSNLKSG